MAGRDFPTNRGGLCQKGWTSAALLRTPDRITTPLVRGRGRDAGPGDVGGGARPGGRPPLAGPPRARRRRGRRLRRRRPHQREGLPARQVRPGGPGHGQHRLQRPVLHVQRRGGGEPIARHRPRAALPAGRPRRGRGRPAARQQHRRDDAAGRAAPCRGPCPRRPRRGRPAPQCHRRADRGRAGTAPPAACPAPTSWCSSPCCTSSWPRGWPTRHTSRSARRGWRTLRRSVAPWWPERAERECGVPADGAARDGPAAGGRQPGPRRARARSCSPGAAWSSPPRAPATVTAAINLALALGLPGRPSSGYGAVTGQGNGQGGREHGQKADQLPGYRMIDDPAAREHVAGVWGVAPETLPGRGMPAVELLQSLGTDGRPEGAARARLEPGRQRAERRDRAPAAAQPRPAGRVRLRPVRDRRAGRRRPAGDPVGRGGGHHDVARGPGPPAPQGPGPAGGCAVRAVGLVGAGPAPRLPRRLRHRAGGRLRRAGPGQRRRQGRLQRAQPRPARRRGTAPLAVPRGTRGGAPPGHAAAVHRRLPHG